MGASCVPSGLLNPHYVPRVGADTRDGPLGWTTWLDHLINHTVWEPMSPYYVEIVEIETQREKTFPGALIVCEAHLAWPCRLHMAWASLNMPTNNSTSTLSRPSWM